MAKIELGEIEVINPRGVWKHEERDFTPWVAENIAKISEVIGVPIIIEQTEQKVGNYELDIYGKVEGKDSIVIIENQLNSTDHVHLGQLLTYAGGLEASIVIWIATDVRDEHRSALEWLNRISNDKASFFLLRPEVIRIGDSKPAVKFHLEVGPSDFERRVREIVETGDGPRHEFRMKFWEDLFHFLEEEQHKWAKNRRTTKDSWITSGVGRTGVNVNVSMAQGSRIRVEIYFPNDEDKKHFDKLANSKDKIENMLQRQEVSWERLDGAKASRFAVYRSYDKEKCSSDSPQRSEIYKWISEMLFVLREIAEKIFVKNEDLNDINGKPKITNGIIKP
jgi:hypothetical protein